MSCRVLAADQAGIGSELFARAGWFPGSYRVEDHGDAGWARHGRRSRPPVVQVVDDEREAVGYANFHKFLEHIGDLFRGADDAGVRVQDAVA